MSNLDKLKESIEPLEILLDHFLKEIEPNMGHFLQGLKGYFEEDGKVLNALGGSDMNDRDAKRYLESILRMEGMVSVIKKLSTRPFGVRVAKWADDRSITQNGTIEGQLMKLDEEVQELKDALTANNEEEIIDACGDISVVVAVLSHMRGWQIEQCQEHAWNCIKDRTGSLNSEGVFVKDE